MVTPHDSSSTSSTTLSEQEYSTVFTGGRELNAPLSSPNYGIGTSRSVMLVRSYISWGSVIAGSVLALSLLILSGSLAYACGVPAYFGGAVGWGAGVWSVLTAGIAFFCGGCLAAYFASAAQGKYRMLHGVMTWALAIPLLGYFFIGTLGAFVTHTGVVVSGGPGGLIFPSYAAAWGSFISLLVGLVFAFIGGNVGSSMQDRIL